MKRGGGSGSAWWAAGRAHSSAPCIASRRAWTTSIEFVAGALSSDAGDARKASGAELGLDPDRIYGDFQGDGEARGQRDGRHRGGVDRHAEPHACAGRAWHSSRRGIHVICDKPLALDARGGEGAGEAAREEPDAIFALTHNYTGYPMIRQARGHGARRRARRDPRSCRANIRRTG